MQFALNRLQLDKIAQVIALIVIIGDITANQSEEWENQSVTQRLPLTCEKSM